jgi:hypothetical protein
MRGDQTLEDLHHAIFDAFGRWEQHMYEFQFGKGPMDPKATAVKTTILPKSLQLIELQSSCTSFKENMDATRLFSDRVGAFALSGGGPVPVAVDHGQVPSG